MKSIKRSIIIFFLITTAFSCSDNKIKSTAIGKVEEIAICASEDTYGMTEKNLLSSLTKEVFLPVRESVFFTIYVPLNKLQIFKREKNVIFVVNTSKNDDYSKIIKSYINDEQMAQIDSSGSMILTIFDGFADAQNIMIIAGKDDEQLNKSINENSSGIFKYFLDNAYRPLKKMVYFTGNNQPLQKEIRDRLGLSIEIPSDYYKSFYDSAMSAYSVIAHSPERVLTVRLLGKRKLGIPEIIAIRDSIGRKYWNGDAVDTVFVKVQTDSFLYEGKKCIELRGVWSNETYVYGGPFITRVIYTSDGAVMLDGHIMMPGDRKYFKLMETAAIMNTLRIE